MVQPALGEPSVPYTVKAKDKLIVLSEQLLNTPSDWPQVARFNRLGNPNVLRLGQTIHVPLRLMKYAPANGKVISIFGDVQLQDRTADVGGAVPEGSKLQTGANSSAVVELADGSRITLLPNTLAELATSRSYATRDAATSGSAIWFSGLIRLVQGALDTVAAKSVKRATPLQIETPTSTVGVRGTEFRVAFDAPATENARTEVLEGLIRADNTLQRSSAEVAQGKGALVNPRVKEIKVVDLLKAPDLSATPSDIFKPLALWPMPALEGAKSFRVQVAGDEGFNQIARNLLVTSGSADLSSLPDGAWFARIRGIDASGIEGYDSVKVVQVVLAPRPWRVSQSRLDAVAGRHILQFSPQGLDGSHTIVATVTTDKPPYSRIAQSSATGNLPRISLDLGIPAAGGPLRLHLTVSQTEGETVSALTYRFETLGSWGQAEDPLQPVTADKP